MKVLLIGCGNTGSAIAKRLSKKEEIEKIFLYSRTSKSSKRLEEEIHQENTLSIQEIEEAKEVDYVILALSSISDGAQKKSFNTRKNTFEVRQDELKFNLGSVSHIVEDLKNINIQESIIVVTNPMDEITNYLRIMLAPKKILGFGMDLDSKRYSIEIGKKVYCIGTHGKAIPLLNLSKESEYKNLYHNMDKKLLEYIRKNGIPHEAAGEAFMEFFNKLTSPSEETIHVSYYLDKSFLGVDKVSVSLPYRVKNGKIIDIANLSVNNTEKKRFLLEVKELKRSVNQILVAHKKLSAYK